MPKKRLNKLFSQNFLYLKHVVQLGAVRKTSISFAPSLRPTRLGTSFTLISLVMRKTNFRNGTEMVKLPSYCYSTKVVQGWNFKQIFWQPMIIKFWTKSARNNTPLEFKPTDSVGNQSSNVQKRQEKNKCLINQPQT